MHKYILTRMLILALVSTSVYPLHVRAAERIPSSFTFKHNLSKGTTRYPDVVHLKTFLNARPETALQTDHCVSTYMDSYFDQNTKTAVEKFQYVYKDEILNTSNTNTATGIVATKTRTKINALLKTPAYAHLQNGSSTTTVPQDQVSALEHVVNQYLNIVNQNINNQTTSTQALQTVGSSTLASTSAPVDAVAERYLSQIDTLLSNLSINRRNGAIVVNSSSTTPRADTTSSTTSPATSTQNLQVPESVSIAQAYLRAVQYDINNRSTSQQSTTSISTINNPVVAQYLAQVNNTLSGVSNTPSSTTTQTITAATTSATDLNTSTQQPSPRILYISPATPSVCSTFITLIGQHFSPTQNLLIGNMGTLIATSQTISTTSTSTIQAITFKLKDFTDYMYNQSIYAGQTKDIVFTVMANGQTSDDLAVLPFTFPGETRSAKAILHTKQTIKSSNMTNVTVSGSTTTSPNTSILVFIEQIGLQNFMYTSQGTLIRLIGGERAMDILKTLISPTYSIDRPTTHTPPEGPSATSNQNTSTSNNSTNSTKDSGKIILGVLAGIGIAIGVSALVQGSSAVTGAVASKAATGAVLRNFGGPILVSNPCNCSGTANLLLTIKDVRGPVLQLVFQPGLSRLYGYGVLRPGAQTLGNYVLAPSLCTCGTSAVPIGIITQIGTSL